MTQHGYCIQLLDRHGRQTAMHMGEVQTGEDSYTLLKKFIEHPNSKRKLRDEVHTFIFSRYRKEKNMYIMQEPPAVAVPDAWKLKAKKLGLTNAQINVLEKLREGHTGKTAAALLHISENTLDVHRNNAFSTLEVHKLQEAFRILDSA
jgi:DNA-binding NarL/FixJ family response regulator